MDYGVNALMAPFMMVAPREGFVEDLNIVIK
jgi:hypothetical protein